MADPIRRLEDLRSKLELQAPIDLLAVRRNRLPARRRYDSNFTLNLRNWVSTTVVVLFNRLIVGSVYITSYYIQPGRARRRGNLSKVVSHEPEHNTSDKKKWEYYWHTPRLMRNKNACEMFYQIPGIIILFLPTQSRWDIRENLKTPTSWQIRGPIAVLGEGEIWRRQSAERLEERIDACASRCPVRHPSRHNNYQNSIPFVNQVNTKKPRGILFFWVCFASESGINIDK